MEKKITPLFSPCETVGSSSLKVKGLSQKCVQKRGCTEHAADKLAPKRIRTQIHDTNAQKCINCTIKQNEGKTLFFRWCRQNSNGIAHFVQTSYKYTLLRRFTSKYLERFFFQLRFWLLLLLLNDGEILLFAEDGSLLDIFQFLFFFLELLESRLVNCFSVKFN